jgi:hypothetical protein
MRGGSVLRDLACDPAAVAEFAAEAARGLAAFELEDLGEGNLSLVFALSAWSRTAGIGIEDARAGLLQLRRALIDCSGLDKRTEPVPLLAGQPLAALLGLAVYVHGLICRSALHKGRSPCTVVEEALTLLG